MRVRVLSQAEVEAGAAEGVDAIISIRAHAPAPGAGLDLAVQQAVLGDLGAMLVLRFDDVGLAAYGCYRGPAMDDLVAALEFARTVRDRAPDPALAVHCLHGRSRSAAIALAVLADTLGAGAGAEEEAVAALLRQDVEGRMHPNPRLVSLADTALYRYGRLDAALAAACPRYARWRDHWRTVAADPERHWEQARRVRVRPRPR